MKSHKRRSRIVAGLALLAASAAVASAMLGVPATAAATARLPLASGLSAQLPIARAAHHPRVKLAVSGPRKRVQAMLTASGPTPGAIAAPRFADTASSGLAVAVSPTTWWLDFAGSCSRTRGQPPTDALT